MSELGPAAAVRLGWGQELKPSVVPATAAGAATALWTNTGSAWCATAQTCVRGLAPELVTPGVLAPWS